MCPLAFVPYLSAALCFTHAACSDDLAITIENLIERQKKNRIEYIFIETSGLADPAALAKSFWLDEQLHSDIYLDGIVSYISSIPFITSSKVTLSFHT